MSEAELAAESVVAAPPKSKAIPMVLAVNTLLVAGVLVFTLSKKHAAPAAATAAEETAEGEKSERPSAERGQVKHSMGPTVRLDNFVVQLKAVEAEKYAHLVIEVEVPVEEDKNIILKYMPRIRDTVVAFLADRTADELRGSEGIAKLKQEIFERLQKVVPGQRVVQLFVTDFIVQ